MGLFGDSTTITTTFAGKDNLSPVVRGMRATMQRFKADAATGFGLASGFSVFGLATKAIGFVTDAIGDAAKAASDMQETQTKLDAVFTESADVMREWAESAATSMGLSTQKALEAAGTFGNFLQAMGQAEPAAADMSRAMVQLAGDLASFNNQDPTEVLVNLRSGLAGETEPLRKFGIDVSDAAVELELLNQGVRKTGREFTQAQKVQGRYALIMKQTTRAQGDYIRTAGGTANKQRTLNAEVANAQAALGGFADTIINTATGALIDLVRGLGDASDAFHNLERFLSPHLALQEELNERIQELAKARGLDGDAIIEYTKRLREAKEAQQQKLVWDRVDIELAKMELGLYGDLTAEQQALVDAYLANKGATKEVAEETKDLTAEAEALIRAFTDAGAGSDEWQARLRALQDSMQSMRDTASSAVLDTITKVEEAMTGAATTTAVATEKMVESFTSIPTGLKGALKEAKKEARIGMAALKWAFEHPWAQKRLENFYRRKAAEMMRAFTQAQDEGNQVAMQQAKDLRDYFVQQLHEIGGMTRQEARQIRARLRSIAAGILETLDIFDDDVGTLQIEPRHRRRRRRRQRRTGGGDSSIALMSAPAAAMGGGGGGDVYLDGEKVGKMLDRRNGRALAMYGVSARI